MSSEGHFEAKKHAYRQTQDGIVVSFVVHPSDMSEAIAMAPLGTRFMVAFAEIGDNEEVIKPAPENNAKVIEPKPKQRFADMPLSQQAVLRCKDAAFQEFIVDRSGLAEVDAAWFVRDHCKIASRSELSTNGAAAKKWMLLEASYQNWLTDQRHAESIRR